MAHKEAMMRDLEALLDKHKPTAAEFGAAVADVIYNAEAMGRLDKAAPQQHPAGWSSGLHKGNAGR